MIEVRRLHPRDAGGVVALVHEAHGDGYPRRELYAPQSVVELHEAGKLVGAVALDDSGRIVGFASLEPSAFGAIAELGTFMVSVPARRLGVAELLRDFLLEEAQRLQLVGEYVEVGCAETAAQAICERAAIVPCGLMLGLWPDSRAVASGEDGERPRLSFVRYFRALAPLPPSTLHVPSHFRAMISRIQGRLGRDVCFGQPADPPAQGAFSVRRRVGEQCVFLTAPRIGADSARAVEDATREFRADDALSYACLELPLAQPGAIELCMVAESLGYGFASMTPCAFRDGDGLRLQYVKEPVPTDDLVVLSPFARELLTWMTSSR